MDAKLTALTERFSKDRFVSENLAARITAASEGYARCEMDILPMHCNAIGIPMGGVLFTLADFAFAVAANQGDKTVVTQAAQITFLTPATNSHLIAEASIIRDGAQTSFYKVLITDGTGAEIAFATATGFRIREER